LIAFREAIAYLNDAELFCVYKKAIKEQRRFFGPASGVRL